MLMLVGKRYFILYSACDMGIFFLLKIVRGDFHHWFPIHGSFGLFISILIRVITKVISDYTGLLQTRGSAELGGLYWSTNVCTAIFAPLAANKFYYARTKPSEFVMEERTAWWIACSLGGSWLICFMVFLKLMKRKYRRTFFSTETGNEWAVGFFLKGDSDATRVKPLRLKRNLWKKIRPLVKGFVLDKWEEWEEEQPDFFTEVFKSRVPDDMLPVTELRKQKKKGGGMRRKSSLGELVMPSVRRASGGATVVPTSKDEDAAGFDALGGGDDVGDNGNGNGNDNSSDNGSDNDNDNDNDNGNDNGNDNDNDNNAGDEKKEGVTYVVSWQDDPAEEGGSTAVGKKEGRAV
jgi:hypothetical protein